jgi:hypothetical protein
VPSFCRHNRFIDRCPICSPQPAAPPPRSARTAARSAVAAGRHVAGAGRDGLRVRRERRAADDGYRSTLIAGIRSSDDAQRLAGEIAFAAGRLALLAAEPPGLYATVATDEDVEQALWTALLIAYLGPLEDEQPFAAIESVVTDWHSGELPDLDGVALGPRTSHDPARGVATLTAYRQWAGRAGSQLRAFTGDESWSPERRFDRVFERLTLPGFGRPGRYELLTSVGALGRAPLHAASLQLVGDDESVLGAKRVFGIGDRVNLERRALTLAEASEVPLAALDVALCSFSSGERVAGGVPDDIQDPGALERAQDVLGLT